MFSILAFMGEGWYILDTGFPLCWYGSFRPVLVIALGTGFFLLYQIYGKSVYFLYLLSIMMLLSCDIVPLPTGGT